MSGEANMRRDRELYESLEKAGADDAAPVLRLYSWRPWTVSLGRAQEAERVLDLAALSERGYDWVQRPTGGRAVFHAEEITYSIAAPLSGPFAASLAESHRGIGRALRRFYRSLGVAAELTHPSPARELDPRIKAPCFVASGLAELELAGRKLAGSAQRRGRRAFLQHGSLLTGPAHLELADLLPLDDAALGREARLRLAERSVSLAEVLDEMPGPDMLRDALVEAFAREFGVGEWLRESP